MVMINGCGRHQTNHHHPEKKLSLILYIKVKAVAFGFPVLLKIALPDATITRIKRLDVTLDVNQT